MNAVWMLATIGNEEHWYVDDELIVGCVQGCQPKGAWDGSPYDKPPFYASYMDLPAGKYLTLNAAKKAIEAKHAEAASPDLLKAK